MKTNLDDHRERESREQADLISLFFALFGAGFIVFAAAFNEFLLGYLDPQPPLSTEVIATVRTGQLQTLIIGLVLTASAVVAMELVLRPLTSFYRVGNGDRRRGNGGIPSLA